MVLSSDVCDVPSHLKSNLFLIEDFVLLGLSNIQDPTEVVRSLKTWLKSLNTETSKKQYMRGTSLRVLTEGLKNG
ncbi:MAG: hypothetical protein ACK416_01910 [Zestosphaera sp.]